MGLNLFSKKKEKKEEQEQEQNQEQEQQQENDSNAEAEAENDSSDNNEEKKEEKGLMQRVNDYVMQFSRVPLKEKLFFIQYFGIMFKTGISLSVIMRTLSQQTSNKYFSKVISEVGEKVERGESLADSFRPYKNVFGELFINMIEAGEMSGNLENVLDQLYTQTKKQSEITSKVKGALTYPAVLLLAMIAIGVFMMTFVVPRLTGVLESFGTELPLPTKILIGISDFVTSNGLLVGGITIALVLIVVQILRTYRGKYYFDWMIVKMPIIGPIIKKVNLARFARTTSSLLKTDILIVKSFRITSNILGNLLYKEAIQDMSHRIEKGAQINEIISEYPKLFPPVVNQIVLVGEETGELDSILLELADFYEKEVDSIMDNLPSIIEPILILLLGVGVGGMAIAIIMPMYSMTSSI